MALALADFSDDRGFCYPSVAALAVKCRTTTRHANRLISQLVESGELEVQVGEGPPVRGGRLNRYRIRLEVLIARKEAASKAGLWESKGVTYTSEEVTGSSGLSGVTPVSEVTSKAKRGDVDVQEGVTPMSAKPSENHQEPSGNTSASKSRKPSLVEQFPEFLVGLDPQVLADWEALRKKKRAQISETVLSGLANKARLAKMPLVDVLRMMVERNWQGFELEWLESTKAKQGLTGWQEHKLRNAQAIGIMLGAVPMPTDKHRGFDVGTYLEDATDGRIPD